MSPLHRTRGAECLSDLLLDRLAAGELDEGARAAAETHLAGCSRCAERRLSYDQERAELAQAPLPPALARAIAARPAPARRFARRWPAALATGVALAAGALLFLRIGGSGPDGGSAPGAGGERRKGSAHFALFALFVRHGAQTRAAAPGEIVAPGDTLQLACTSPKAGYVAVLSRDPEQVVSVYFPADPGAATAAPLAAGTSVELPSSTVLDDTLGGETLYALHCAQPEPLAGLRAQLAAHGTLAPPAGCTVEEIRLEKRR